ncbi:MAG: N-acetylglucosamine-6-phosphate deacetylase [Firmicutes bacterium]|nr:N-acetylglucosamine-6-phosphate deacetylase [Bacillota bacterium]
MLIQGARILNDRFEWEYGDLRIADDTIEEIGQLEPLPGETIFSAEGKNLIPGMIDVHMHGYHGISCTAKTSEVVKNIGIHLAKEGVTGYAAGIASSPDEKAFRSIRNNVVASREWKDFYGAEILGIHMEGPFLNLVKKGAMNEKAIVPPSAVTMQQYLDLSEGLFKIMTIAPEMPGAEEVIRMGVENGVKMSIGHTNATYEQTKTSFSWGITRATHTFNAMPSLNHRQSAVLGAVLNDDTIQCELIGDLVHVAPEVCQILIRQKETDHITLISDSCELGGLSPEMIPTDLPYVIGKAAYLSNGTLCGSICTVSVCVRNMMSLGVPMNEAVKMGTINPARDLGLQDEYGSIREGKKASLVLMDDQLKVSAVWIRGKQFM